MDLLEESQASSFELGMLATPPVEEITIESPSSPKPIKKTAPKKRRLRRKKSGDITTFDEYMLEKGQKTIRSKIQADYSMKRLKNLTPIDFDHDAKPKVSTGRETKETKEEKFKVLLRK